MSPVSPYQHQPTTTLPDLQRMYSLPGRIPVAQMGFDGDSRGHMKLEVATLQQDGQRFVLRSGSFSEGRMGVSMAENGGGHSGGTPQGRGQAGAQQAAVQGVPPGDDVRSPPQKRRMTVGEANGPFSPGHEFSGVGPWRGGHETANPPAPGHTPMHAVPVPSPSQASVSAGGSPEKYSTTSRDRPEGISTAAVSQQANTGNMARKSASTAGSPVTLGAANPPTKSGLGSASNFPAHPASAPRFQGTPGGPLMTFPGKPESSINLPSKPGTSPQKPGTATNVQNVMGQKYMHSCTERYRRVLGWSDEKVQVYKRICEEEVPKVCLFFVFCGVCRFGSSCCFCALCNFVMANGFMFIFGSLC